MKWLHSDEAAGFPVHSDYVGSILNRTDMTDEWKVSMIEAYTQGIGDGRDAREQEVASWRDAWYKKTTELKECREDLEQLAGLETELVQAIAGLYEVYNHTHATAWDMGMAVPKLMRVWEKILEAMD